MKTTIYELLGMIKDNKALKKIHYENKTYFYDEDAKDYLDCDKNYGLIEDYIRNSYGITNSLNDEVEILETTIPYKQDNYYQYQPYTGEPTITKPTPYEPYTPPKEDKIEKLDLSNGISVVHCAYKINEIIDYINKE